MGISNFFQDLGNFFGSGGSVLGVDIGTGSIKIAEVSTKGDNFSLDNYGILETKDYLLHPNLALQSGPLSLDINETSRLLKILINEMAPRSRTAIMSIPSSVVYVNLIDAPSLSEDELKNFIKIQAHQYVPIPMEQASIDWLVVDEYKTQDNKYHKKIMIIGMPKQTLQTYKTIAKNAGLKLVSLELDVIALSRSFRNRTSPIAVVDIGAESTTILVTEGGLPKYIANTNYSGVHVTRAISSNLELGMFRAEDLKKRQGLSNSNDGEEFSSLITPFLNVIIQEVDRAIKGYEGKYGKKVTQMSLVGGGANLSGITDHFIEKLGIEYVPSNTFNGFNISPELQPISQSLSRELPFSVGLAKNYFNQ